MKRKMKTRAIAKAKEKEKEKEKEKVKTKTKSPKSKSQLREKRGSKGVDGVEEEHKRYKPEQSLAGCRKLFKQAPSLPVKCITKEVRNLLTAQSMLTKEVTHILVYLLRRKDSTNPLGTCSEIWPDVELLGLLRSTTLVVPTCIVFARPCC